MPWWNLPETMRAAAGVAALWPSSTAAAAAVFGRCADAYFAHFVKPGLGMLPLQTRAADGVPIDVIPAMPDADPLYHVGLTLIDVFEWEA
jgi:hypothetical protein